MKLLAIGSLRAPRRARRAVGTALLLACAAMIGGPARGQQIIADLSKVIPREDARDGSGRPVTPVVTALAIDAAGKLLATAGDDHCIRIGSFPGGQIRHTLQGHGDWVHDLRFSLDSSELFSVAADGTVRAWNVATGKQRAILYRGAQQLAAVTGSANTRELFFVGFGTPLRQLDTPTGSLAGEWKCPERDMRIVALSPDGARVAAAGRRGHVRVWSHGTGQEERTFQVHDRRLRGMAFLPQGERLVTIGEDRAICIWDVARGVEVAHWNTHAGRLLSLAVLDDTHIAIGTSLNDIAIWNLETKSCERTLRGHSGSVAALARSGAWLVSGSYDATVRVWDLDGTNTVAQRPVELEKQR